MKLWLIERMDKCKPWDEYDAAVVVATSAKAARHIHPDAESKIVWNASSWVASDEATRPASTWVNPDGVKATLLGQTRCREPGVVLASFNAG